MSVEINGLPGRTIQNAGDNRQVASAKSAAGGSPQAKPSSDDRVSLTSSATQLRELSDRVGQLPEVNTELVTEAQRAIATGSLRIEPATAANNLLTQEKELATLKVQP